MRSKSLEFADGEPAVNIYTAGGCFKPHENGQRSVWRARERESEGLNKGARKKETEREREAERGLESVRVGENAQLKRERNALEEREAEGQRGTETQRD